MFYSSLVNGNYISSTQVHKSNCYVNGTGIRTSVKFMIFSAIRFSACFLWSSSAILYHFTDKLMDFWLLVDSVSMFIQDAFLRPQFLSTVRHYSFKAFFFDPLHCWPSIWILQYGRNRWLIFTNLSFCTISYFQYVSNTLVVLIPHEKPMLFRTTDSSSQ